MAVFELNIVEDLPIGGQGTDQQLINIDSWGAVDLYILENIDEQRLFVDSWGTIETYVETPGDFARVGFPRFLNILEPILIGNQGIDQQLINIDTWPTIDSYVENPSDTVTKDIVYNIADLLAIIDSIALLPEKDLVDVINIVDSISTPFITKQLPESLNFLSQYANGQELNLYESFRIIDSFRKTVDLLIEDILEFTEFSDAGDGIFGYEALKIRERLTTSITKNITEDTLVLVDTFAKEEFIKAISTELAIGDTFNLDYNKNVNDSFSLIDSYVRALDAKLSHMVLSNTAISNARDFALEALYSSPAGYARYTPYIQGNYEYQKARIRAIVAGEFDEESSTEISKIEVDVDIPDTTDRSLAPITITAAESDAGGKVVPYNRFFYHPPEVAITVANTTVVKIPRIISQTNTDMTIAVVDSSGNSIDADISWIAEGY